MRNVYLALAIIGAVVPYIFFAQFFADPEAGSFAAALFANGAAGGFSADLLISSAVFWIFLWQRQARRAWIYILINLTIGLSCALPAYLYMESRRRSGNQPQTVTG